MIKHAPVVLQLSDTECGVASLAMIFAYYKLNVPLEELRDQCAVGRDGCKAQTLIDVATHYGFIADAWQVDVDTISQLSSPVIAHWKFSHYIVVNRVSRDKIYINDPAIGAMTVTKAEFDRAFTGVIINISPGSHSQQRKARHGMLKIVHYWLMTCYRELIFLLLCLIIASISPSLNLGIYSILIDQCIISRNMALLAPLLVLSSALFATLLIATHLQKIKQSTLISNSSLMWSERIIRHIMRLPLLFYSLRQRNEILAIATRVEIIIHSIFTNTLNMAVAVITSLVCLIFMVKIHFLLAIGTIATTSIYTILSLIISRLSLSYEKSNTSHSAKLYSHSIASIKNMETIYACGLQELTIRKWRSLFLRNVLAKDKIKSLDIISSCSIKSYHSISILSMLLIGSLNISDLMAFYALNIIFCKKVSDFIKGMTDTVKSYAQHNRINDIELYNIDHRHTQSLNIFNAAQTTNEVISCNNVSFYYNLHNRPTLENITLLIKKNQHVAFIGHTGSGKSTLAKLLCALYQPHSGEIRLFDKNINIYSARDLARMCAYVAQDVTLFSGTLYKNLTYGRNQGLDAINTAIKIACLESLISERGLYAAVEEGGKNFSGGEKQLIDIARALLQDTPVLILDEATSALDNETQLRLISNLRKIDKTIIFVAHRLSSIKHCDQILLFNFGKITKYEIFSFQK